MKILFTMLFLSCSLSLNAGGWASGGGDPKEVKAKVFPYMGKIIDAVNLLKSNLDKTYFNNNFKRAFKEDMDLMVKNSSFYYVPELFAVGFNRHPGDYTRLYSNGAMTEFKKGAPIYFSKQSIKYDVRTLARVIAQEIPHHIFTGRFQRDETFANNLGTYLVLLDKVPTKPYNANQIIYEEFDHELRDSSSLRIIEEARDDFHKGEDVLEVLYRLAHELYKNRGSYSWYHVEHEPPLTREKLFKKFPKTADISKLTKVKYNTIAKCMFTTYEDKASGITPRYQKLLTETFIKMLGEFKSKLSKFYITEDFYLPSEKEVSDCGFGIEDNQGRVWLYQSVFRHEDNQCGQPGNPCSLPKP